MNKIAKFEKVSLEQFSDAWRKAFGDKYESVNPEVIDKVIMECYDNIKLPKRATHGSAGYDFFLPFNLSVMVGESVLVPTGIRCKMDDGWVLQLYPRSGHGFKYGIHVANTVGIIDSDYFYANNEGHIMVKLVNDSVLAKDVLMEDGDAFCQGVFVPFGITIDDDTDEVRVGGFGSTNKK